MKTKFNLDREQLDSSYIKSRQDFEKVVKGYRAMKPPLWKNPWFYGPAGLASIAIILSFTLQNNLFANDNNSTLNKASTASISELPDDTPCLNLPLKNIEIPFEHFSITPSKGGEIITSNGSKVSIPKNSLVSTTDKPVDIQIREFNDQSTVFSAGVPMDYKKDNAFESGGMLEIRGTQNGKTVGIAQDKPIRVNMSLYNSGKDFKFWSMNDQSGEWTEYPANFTQDLNSKSTSVKRAKVSDSKEITLIQTEVENCEKEIINLSKSESKSILLPTKYTRKLFIDFDSNEFPELAGYKDVEFEYVHPLSQRSAEMAAFEKKINYAVAQTWTDMDVKKRNNAYQVVFKNARETYSLPVKPVLKGNSLAQFEQELKKAEQLKSSKIAELEKKKAELKKREVQLKKEFEASVKDLTNQLNQRASANSASNQLDARTAANNSKMLNLSSKQTQGRAIFSVVNFGVYNCDRPIPYPETFNNEVLCLDHSGNAIKTSGAYVFDLKKKVRYSYGTSLAGKSLNQLSWNNSNSTLIIIDMEGNLFYKKQVNEQTSTGLKITMDRVDGKNVTLDDIKKIISENSIVA